ncbi:MAG: peptidylprolyl isomerase [Planctomycetaceae bacterium]
MLLRLLLLAFLCAAAVASGPTETEIAAAELARRFDETQFRAALASPSAAVRRTAARALGRIRDPRGSALLLTMLGDAAGPVRRAALFGLGQIGSRDALLPLREALGGMEPNDAAFAVEALGRLRDPRAVSAIAALLRAREPQVREAAALALFRQGDGSVLPELFAALAEERLAEPRWKMTYAIWRLCRAQAPPAPPPVWRDQLGASIAADRPFHERVFATLALGALGGSDERIVELFADSDPRVVVAALRDLTRPFDPEVARTVVALARSADEMVAETAVEHLAACGKGALPFLEEAATFVPQGGRLRLALDLARAAAGAGSTALAAPLTGDRAATEEWTWRVGPYAGLLSDRIPETVTGRAAAAEVCGEERIPRDLALRVLLQLVTVEDFVVRATAVASLGKRGDASHVGVVTKAAAASPGTAFMDVRIEAAKALAALKLHDAWLDAAAAGDPDAPVRTAAAQALRALGRSPPPLQVEAGYRLHGLDAAGILRAARGLRGTRVLLETDRGGIEISLFPDEAPAHCVGFATLVRQGFYDGLTWHRVVADFVIQGGCPRGDGSGGPGYLVPDEIGTRPYTRGTVGMPKSDDDTGGCQIFITPLPTPHLDGRYSVFGQVVAGLAVVDRIRVGDRIVKATLLGP